MKISVSVIVPRALLLFFLLPASAWAWGGAEHQAITAAAVSVLSPPLLAFLGYEAARLIKVYCQYPDFNWAVYGTCAASGDKVVRIPDKRRDFEASRYCDFDEVTGRGLYYGHGPAIGRELPAPDEHARYMYARGDFSSSAIRKFTARACDAFEAGNYFDAIRFIGVVVHYLEDNTPPPHTLGIPGGSNARHHEMEAIEDHADINISGYSPRPVALSAADLPEKAGKLADTIALQAQVKAKILLDCMKKGEQNEVAKTALECANMAAKAAADLITAFHEIYRHNLPGRPTSQSGANLVFNPSFDFDDDGDLQPDGWVREWTDLSQPRDAHLWDRVSTRGRGACVRLYNSKAGVAWRTAKVRAIPVQKGESYRLTGMLRPQSSSGENYLALRFQDAVYNVVQEVSSEKLSAPCDWREVSVEVTVPANAVDALVVCASKNNSGAVLFDNINLERMG